MYTNVFYIGDSRADFFADIEAKAKTIWIPSRTLQVLMDLKQEDYVRFMQNTIGEQFIITNDLFSNDVFDFIGLNTKI